jgi:hypothetical protein
MHANKLRPRGVLRVQEIARAARSYAYWMKPSRSPAASANEALNVVGRYEIKLTKTPVFFILVSTRASVPRAAAAAQSDSSHARVESAKNSRKQ